MIDLHCHTTFSDGSLTPEELIDKSITLGLKAIAITDHDTIDGLESATKYAKNKDIEVIKGVEIEIQFPGKGEFHLLGLGFKQISNDLKTKLKDIQRYRIDRNKEIINRFKRDSINITFNELLEMSSGKVIARPHFSKLLIKKGYAKNQKDAFKNFLNPNAPYYVEKRALELQDAINTIHNSGGKAIIAHPLSLYLSWSKLESTLKEYKKIGLDGIEAWHGGNSKKECTKLESIASKLRLIVSGGSDYHGDNIHGRNLGVGAGERPIPEVLLNNFI